MTRLSLRPFDPRRDTFDLLEAYADPRERAQFALEAPTGDVRAFDAWLAGQLRGAYAEFRVAVDAVTGTFAGFAYAYDMRAVDGHCKVCVYVAPAHRKAGTGAWLAAAFMGRLFELYPLRKVYALVYAYNRQSLESCGSAGFEEECRLRAYRYFDGAYHDCAVLSLSRERYYERVAPLVGAGAGTGADGRTGGACVGFGRPGFAAEGHDAGADAVLDVLLETCGRTPALDERLCDDLGFDSFDMLSLTVGLEDRLCREIDAGAMAGLQTVGDLCAVARKALCPQAEEGPWGPGGAPAKPEVPGA